MTFSLKNFGWLVALVAVAVIAAISTGTARAATVYQLTCSINGVAGTGVAVDLGNGMFALQSCHTGDKTMGRPLIIRSGTCMTSDDSLNICAGFRP